MKYTHAPQFFELKMEPLQVKGAGNLLPKTTTYSGWFLFYSFVLLLFMMMTVEMQSLGLSGRRQKAGERRKIRMCLNLAWQKRAQ